MASPRVTPIADQAIDALGQRHKSCGVSESNYDTVGQVLISTLELGLGKDFTPAVRDAWKAVFSLVSDTMKTAARAAA
ncbi:MAG TPA: globin domain-containing protein [Methylocella sp.]|nr:globin domain-containing protein [Methylocella sp.]